MIKSLGADLPPPLPGAGRAPLELALPGEATPIGGGGEVELADLRGYLLHVSELPLAEPSRANGVLDRLRARRDRLRGLGSSVVHVHVASGGDRAALVRLLDERRGRSPVHVYLLDREGEAWGRLLAAAGAPAGTQLLLLDRHGRPRGAYGPGEAEEDRLVMETGQLANWPGSDPSPAAHR